MPRPERLATVGLLLWMGACQSTSVAPTDSGPGNTNFPPLATNGQRPQNFTGKGFYVSGGKVYDANGNEFRIQGPNHNHCWGVGDGTIALNAISSIAKAGATGARAVLCSGMGANTPEAHRALIEEYVNNGLVPMLELHEVTCSTDPTELEQVVDIWLQEDTVQLLKDYEPYVMVNITNEWGPYSTVWRDSYITAVQRLRSAGINALLVIDAGGNCGQDPRSIIDWGTEILQADPQQNVLFSIHMYGYWLNPGSPDNMMWDDGPFDMEIFLNQVQATGLPLVVGEYGWEEFVYGTGPNGEEYKLPYGTRTALEQYKKRGIGNLAWLWYNADGDGNLSLLRDDDQIYASDEDLLPYGQLVVSDPDVGWKATAKSATVFPRP